MAFNNTNSSQSQHQLQNTNEDDQQKKNNLIILVDKDSNDKLDELFDKTLSNKLPLQVPYHMRKLPPSFFNPPSTGSKSPSVSHSRENSTDSAFGSGSIIDNGVGQTIAPQVVAPSAIPSGLAIHHSRAHSSPASLGKLPLNINLNLSALNLGTTTPTNSSPNPNHLISSGAASSNNSKKPQLAGAPNGATSNNATIKSAGSSNPSNNMPHNNLSKTIQHIHTRGRSYDIPSLQHQLQFGELPSGWEQAKTPDGKIYYIKWASKKYFSVLFPSFYFIQWLIRVLFMYFCWRKMSLQYSNSNAFEPRVNEYLEEWNFSKNNISFETSVRKHLCMLKCIKRNTKPKSYSKSRFKLIFKFGIAIPKFWGFSFYQKLKILAPWSGLRRGTKPFRICSLDVIISTCRWRFYDKI